MRQELQPNVRTIVRFMGQISAYWESGEKLEVRFLGQNRTATTSQFGTHAFDEMIEHITAMNLSGLNCYAVINPVPNEGPRNVCDEHI